MAREKAAVHEARGFADNAPRQQEQARWSPHGATDEQENRYEYPLTVSDEAVTDALHKVVGKAPTPGADGVRHATGREDEIGGGNAATH